MTRVNPVKYTPEHMPATAETPYLYLVPTPASHGVGVEASQLADAMERLAKSINSTETLTRTLLARLDEEYEPVEYEHVSAKPVHSVKARFRSVGRLKPREVPLDDE